MEDIQEPRRRNIRLRKNERKYFFIILFLMFSVIAFKKSGFIINVSDSLPLGIYKIINNKEYAVGDYVVINPPSKFKDFIFERGYLSKNGIVKTMLKQIVGTENDKFSAVKSKDIYAFYVLYKNNNEKLGLIHDRDSKGRELPHIDNIILGKNEYFVMGSAYKSFDSRYFGSIHKNEIIYKVKPIWVF